MLKRKKRVRIHLVDPHPAANLPSVEGLLVATRAREYVVAVPRLITAVGANPTELESRWVEIPRERVAFYEVIE